MYACLHAWMVPYSLYVAVGAQLLVSIGILWNRWRPSPAAAAARAGALPSLVLLILALLFMPKMMWAVRLSHTERGRLERERERLKERTAAKGSFLTPAEVGPLPELEIWVVDGRGNDHYHRSTDEFSVVHGTTSIPDTGGWAYDPVTGRLSLACDGLEPKLQRARLHEF